jgi:hypothetical protein
MAAPFRGKSPVANQHRLDPDEAFAELGWIKLKETDLDGVLSKIADLDKRTIVGVDEAPVMLVRGKNASGSRGGHEYRPSHTSHACLNTDLDADQTMFLR